MQQFATNEIDTHPLLILWFAAQRPQQHFLLRCQPGRFDSVAAQDYPADRLEVLVLDGGSTDRSREIAEARVAGRAEVVRLAEREGFGFRDEDFTDNSPGMTAMVK